MGKQYDLQRIVEILDIKNLSKKEKYNKVNSLLRNTSKQMELIKQIGHDYSISKMSKLLRKLLKSYEPSNKDEEREELEDKVQFEDKPTEPKIRKPQKIYSDYYTKDDMEEILELIRRSSTSK